MQELDDYLKEYLDYYFTQVHTSFPGVVTGYDSATRRATIQPSLKRRARNKEYMDFPLLVDVPVLFPGNKKWTIHFPLEKGDEVLVFFSERSLEAWKDVGQDGIEDPDPRRFALSDAYCIPGLQPQEFITTDEKGLQIIHKDAFDGELISQVLMNDARVEVKYKEKAVILIEDDDILVATEKCSFDMSREKIDFTNSTATIIADKDKITVDNGKQAVITWEDGKITLDNGKLQVVLNGDKFAVKNDSKSLFTVIDAVLEHIATLARNVSAHKTVGSPAQHVVSPDDIIKFTQDNTNLTQDKVALATIMEA
jgi:hypothetical protein